MLHSVGRDLVRLQRLQRCLLHRACLTVASTSQLSSLSPSQSSNCIERRKDTLDTVEDSLLKRLAILYARKVGRYERSRKDREEKEKGKEEDDDIFPFPNPFKQTGGKGKSPDLWGWKITIDNNGKKVSFGSGPESPRGRRSRRSDEEKASSEDSDKEKGQEEDDDKNKSEEEKERDRMMKEMKKSWDKLKRAFAIALFVYGIILLTTGPGDYSQDAKVTSFEDLKSNILPTGQIKKIDVVVEREKAYIHTYKETDGKSRDGKPLASVYELTIPNMARFESEVREIERYWGIPPDQWVPIKFIRVETFSNWMRVLLLAGFVGLLFLLQRRIRSSLGKMNITNFSSMLSQNKFTIINPNSKEGKAKLNVKFKDVAGCNEAKVEIKEFVDYLKNPSKYAKLGARLPRGALLTGPPGCGKTLLAKALASECTVSFISINGSEFIEMIGGLGASRIRELFKTAGSLAPSVIYIDEIDTIGRKRSGDNSSFYSGSNSEQEQTLNQLLTEMDGMGTEKSIVVLASTNRPDVLDKALLRPGRFDRHIVIDLPTLIERQEMFDLYLKQIKLDTDYAQFSRKLAQLTPGLSGADIRNICNEAAIHAASHKHEKVSFKDIEYALDRVLAGTEKKSRSISEEEREIVAYHEAGHALVGWLLPNTDALLKVTIIPRTSAALGFAQYNPRDRKLYSKEELLDRMCMMLGGRVAELLQFGRCTTGAQDDLQKVTKSAYAQVKLYGMNENVGVLSFPTNDEFQIKPYSKKFGNLIDQEANRLVARAHQRTEELLSQNKDLLAKIAKNLLQKEVLHYEDVKALIGPPTNEEGKEVMFPVEKILPEEKDL